MNNMVANRSKQRIGHPSEGSDDEDKDPLMELEEDAFDFFVDKY